MNSFKPKMYTGLKKNGTHINAELIRYRITDILARTTHEHMKSLQCLIMVYSISTYIVLCVNDILFSQYCIAVASLNKEKYL